jgi:hypothetical protein
MAGLYQYQCFNRLKIKKICLLLTVACITTVTDAERQQSLPATATDSQSCSLAEHQPTTVCSAEQHNTNEEGSTQSKSAAAFAASFRQLQEQTRTQQQMLSVLSSIASGAFTADAAISLLQEAAELRESLLHGAAARRWAQLKGRSAKARAGTGQQADMQQQQQQQQQQEDTPSQGILIVAGGRHQFLNAYILLQLLRHPTINCTLPVELVYYGAHEFDQAAASSMTAHAAKTGTHLKLVDGAAAAADAELEPYGPFALVDLTGFKTKVHALAFVTTFDQVGLGTAAALCSLR